MDTLIPQNDEFELEHLSATEKFGAWGGDLANRSNGDFILSSSDQYKNTDTYIYSASDDGDLVESNDNPREGHDFVKFMAQKVGLRVVNGPGFNDLVESIQNANGLLGDIENLRAQGNNIAVLTNHPWLLNIAILQAGLYCAVDKPGFAKESGIIISNTLGWLDLVAKKDENDQPLQTIGAIELLRKFCDIYPTIPQTKSAEKFGLKDLSTGFNKMTGMKIFRSYSPKAIEHNGGRGKVLVISPSGSLDIVDPNTGDITMQPVGESLAEKLLPTLFSYALPVTMSIDGDRQMTTAVGSLTPISSADSVHNLMHSISYRYEQLLGNGRRVRYDDPRTRTSDY